jgi:hypothetical protein
VRRASADSGPRPDDALAHCVSLSDLTDDVLGRIGLEVACSCYSPIERLAAREVLSVTVPEVDPIDSLPDHLTAVVETIGEHESLGRVYRYRVLNERIEL